MAEGLIAKLITMVIASKFIYQAVDIVKVYFIISDKYIYLQIA